MSGDVMHTDAASQSDDLALRQALFPGLVYSEDGHEARVVMVGNVAHYAIPDAGFWRHVEAYRIDNVVVESIQEQVMAMREDVVRGVLEMMGSDDILAKAAIEASIRNMGQSIRQSNPAEWAPWLKMYGFRIVVDVHGTVVRVDYPTPPDDGE